MHMTMTMNSPPALLVHRSEDAVDEQADRSCVLAVLNGDRDRFMDIVTLHQTRVHGFLLHALVTSRFFNPPLLSQQRVTASVMLVAS